MDQDAEDHRRDLVGLTREELAVFLESLGVPEKQTRMRANQLWGWIYNHGATEFTAMSNIAKGLQDNLQMRARIGRPSIVSKQASEDGTRKYLLQLDDGNLIETVYIPETDRGTLCISSQVGCTLNCTFCHTGTQKLVRNLTPGDIIAQILVARDDLGEWPSPNDGSRLISNIVLMGMGEPLYNYDHVASAMNIVMSPDGIALSKRRITLSTSGIVPEMARCGEELNVNLAISLHAVRDDLRNELVPINKKYPLAQLMDACRNYPGLSNARRITFEYVMLKNVNDSLDDAKALVKLIEGIPAKINLIPFNPWPGTAYECSDWAQIEKFGDYVNRAGYASPIRMPRGRDIMAACGQLKSASQRARKPKPSQRHDPAHP
ncbi:MAG: 23S rRNA (adenine(2503)-C(2))-methyltransferase RlmN [SAR116 cluster bacterium]|nr:MAG: 23S rRNA (adenine(2503)-C(2))-methyltransferase RlmN [SAR116 cluster bacterium]HCJ62654.1 23S rRNA (adenine(2503)-C(2))-methyltransferase RlmN [Alphaproteobacteria bacterium]